MCVCACFCFFSAVLSLGYAVTSRCELLCRLNATCICASSSSFWYVHVSYHRTNIATLKRTTRRGQVCGGRVHERLWRHRGGQREHNSRGGTGGKGEVITRHFLTSHVSYDIMLRRTSKYYRTRASLPCRTVTVQYSTVQYRTVTGRTVPGLTVPGLTVPYRTERLSLPHVIRRSW